MTQKLLNAITVDLIDELDFVPVEDSCGTALSPERPCLFEKRDISEYSLVRLLDLDCIDETEIRVHYENELDWLSKLEIVDFTGKPGLLEIFLMHTNSPSKIRLIKELQNNAVDKGLNTAFLIMDTKNSELIMDWGMQDYCPQIEAVLWHWLENDPSGFENLPELESIVNRDEPEPVLEFASKTSTATYLLIALNVLVWLSGSLLQLIYDSNPLEDWGIKNNYLISSGQYWRLLTPVFLHADITHLGTNSLSLLIFGSTVERVFGTRKFLLLYFTAGLAGTLMSFFFTKYDSLGASGAILGIGGALIYLWRKNRYFFSLWRQKYLTLVFMVFYNIFYGMISPGIDNYAHFGGFLGGFALASILGFRKDKGTSSSGT